MTVLSADHVVAALRSAFAHEAKRSELLQLAATKIQAAGPPYTSVYLYMVQGDELVLEAYAGRATDLTRIPVGQGVCGTAVATGVDQNIGDVSQSSEYLACSTERRRGCRPTNSGCSRSPRMNRRLDFRR
jgi:GAF domain-containing protein